MDVGSQCYEQQLRNMFSECVCVLYIWIYLQCVQLSWLHVSEMCLGRNLWPTVATALLLSSNHIMIIWLSVKLVCLVESLTPLTLCENCTGGLAQSLSNFSHALNQFKVELSNLQLLKSHDLDLEAYTVQVMTDDLRLVLTKSQRSLNWICTRWQGTT